MLNHTSTSTLIPTLTSATISLAHHHAHTSSHTGTYTSPTFTYNRNVTRCVQSMMPHKSFVLISLLLMISLIVGYDVFWSTDSNSTNHLIQSLTQSISPLSSIDVLTYEELLRLVSSESTRSIAPVLPEKNRFGELIDEMKSNISWSHGTIDLMDTTLPLLHPSSFHHLLQPIRPPLISTHTSFRPRLSTDPNFDSDLFHRQLLSHGYTSDPLPMCSVLNIDLTLNLLQYVRYIQAPHLYTNCNHTTHLTQPDCENILAMAQQFSRTKRYRNGNNLSGSSTHMSRLRLSPRWLQMSCGSSCGGLSDRLKGIFSGFLYALLSGRAFSLDYPSPVPWSAGLLPSVIPWMDATHMNLGRESFDGSSHDPIDLNLLDGFNLHFLPDLSDPTQLVRLRANTNGMSLLFDSYPDLSRRLGFDINEDMDVYFGCFFQALFRPTHQLAKRMQLTHSNQQYRIFPWNQPINSEHTPPQLHQLPAATTRSTSPLFCAQIRLGSSASAVDTGDAGGGNSASSTPITFRDSESFLVPEVMTTVLQHLFDQTIQWRQTNVGMHLLLQSTKLGQPQLHNFNDSNDHENWVSVANRFDDDSSHSIYLQPRLLVTSDASLVFPLLPAYFHSPPFTYVNFDGPIIHIDKVNMNLSMSDKLNGYLRVLSEYLTLGDCDRLIMSTSAFAATAVWRTAWMNGRPNTTSQVSSVYSHVERCDQMGRLTPFEHSRYGNGRPTTIIPNQPTQPTTRDHMTVLVWICLLIVSLVVIGLVIIRTIKLRHCLTNSGLRSHSQLSIQ